MGKVSAAKLESMGLRTCEDVQRSDLALLLKRFGKFGRVLWERSQGIDDRDVNNERLRKSVGVERTLSEDIHDWTECETIITEQLYPELERRLLKVKPDLLIARQGIKLKFNDFQQTTQEHVWPRLNKEDLIATAKKAWEERRADEGEAGGAARHLAGSAAGASTGVGTVDYANRRPGKRSATGHQTANYLTGIAFSSSVSSVQ